AGDLLQTAGREPEAGQGGAPVFRTYTSPSCSATLLGAVPVSRVGTSVTPASATANRLTSPLPAFVTSTCAPSSVITIDPCDVRCATPSPTAPVGNEPSGSSEPSAARANATSLFAPASFVWTYTPRDELWFWDIASSG